MEELGEGLEVTGETGRRTSFEVSLNGAVIFSKLDSGSFPNFDDIVQHVKEVRDTGKSVTNINPAAKTCAVL